MKRSNAETKSKYSFEEERERLTEAFEMRAYGAETAQAVQAMSSFMSAVAHAEPGDLDRAKSRVQGHGEQSIIPDDCQFGDNDLCFVEA